MEIFQNGERRFDSILMAEIMRLFLWQQIRQPAVQLHCAGCKRDQPGKRSEQRRLADAVGAGDNKGLSLFNRKGQILKHPASTAVDRQVFGNELQKTAPHEKARLSC